MFDTSCTKLFVALLAGLFLAGSVFAVAPETPRINLRPVPESAPGIDLPTDHSGVRDLVAKTAQAQGTHVGLDSSSGAVATLVGDLSSGKQGSPDAVAREFLSRDLGLPVAGSSLTLADTSSSQLVLRRTQGALGTSHLTYSHVVAGVPVRGEEVMVHVGANGRVHAVNGTFHPVPAGEYVASLTAKDACARAQAQLGVTDLRDAATVRPIWVPVDGQLKAAYEVNLPAREPLGDFQVVVDARAGTVLGGENLLCNADGEGTVYARSPLHGAPVSTKLTSLDSSGKLTGLYAKVINAKGEGASSSERKFNYGVTDTHFDEVMVYHHVTRVHDFFKKLGYTDRDKPMKATVHYGDQYDNAFYSPMTDSMSFGDGNKLNDLSQEDNVIYHEYTHAVSATITSLSGKEGGAMGEGYSDYFAGTINDDPKIGVWVVKKMNRPWLRNMTNTKHYPEDIQGEVHADGDIWGGVCWDLRKALGADVTDRLLHKSRYYLGSRPSFLKGLDGTIAADKELYSSAHLAKIREVFAARGIKASVEGGDAMKILSRQGAFGKLFGAE